MSRTKEEIDRQINGLEQEKKMIPKISLFGTNNHKIIDFQIKTLKGEFHPEDADPDDDEFESDEEFTDIMEKAEETKDWLKGEHNDDLFEDYSDVN